MTDIQNSTLPDGYEIIKDRVLPVWFVLYQGLFINEHDDHPYKFDSEQAAREFCQRHDQEARPEE